MRCLSVHTVISGSVCACAGTPTPGTTCPPRGRRRKAPNVVGGWRSLRKKAGFEGMSIDQGQGRGRGHAYTTHCSPKTRIEDVWTTLNEPYRSKFVYSNLSEAPDLERLVLESYGFLEGRGVRCPICREIIVNVWKIFTNLGIWVLNIERKVSDLLVRLHMR